MKLIIFCITVGISLMFIYYQNLRKEIDARQKWLETVLTGEKKWILENQGPEGEFYMNGSKAGDVNPYFACMAALGLLAETKNCPITETEKKAVGRYLDWHTGILLSINNVDFIFKNQDSIENTFHEALVLNPEILDALENLTNIPYVVELPDYNFDEIVRLLKREKIRGIAGPFINDTSTDIMKLKSSLLQEGINMYNFAPDLSWEDLKLNSDGMVPVIVQDYRTDEVLMLAYMNKEAFDTTINLGKMTYWSRSRDELWTKGLTSGHFQYVKSLTADCDFDTILAKVSQVGAACHTGNRTCFFNSIVQKEYVEKNPLKVLESVYDIIKERKAHPQDGSYTNYLFGKGTDKILQKLGEECTEIVIAAKNPEPENIKYEISDFLYHCMVLMVEKGITWEEIANELAQR